MAEKSPEVLDPVYQEFKNPETNKYITDTLKELGMPANSIFKATWIKGQIVISFSGGFTISLEKGKHYTSQTEKGESDIIFNPVGKERIGLKVAELNRVQREGAYKKIKENTAKQVSELRTDINETLTA